MKIAPWIAVQISVPASNHEMRPASGDDLVTAALQSSLARAQKNYKLSNFKQFGKSPGKLGRKSEGGEHISLVVGVKKSKPLKFQSEFDLWVEQAQGITFVSEGYTNGATVPEDIECLNSFSGSVAASKAQKSIEKSVSEAIGQQQKNKKKDLGNGLVGSTACTKEKVALGDKKSIVNGEASSVLKGKNKSRTGDLPTENSFEIFKKLNESKKFKKKLIKLRKRLVRVGYSQEEAQKLIEKAESRSEGPGAIVENLKKVILQDKKDKENIGNATPQGKTKKIKMKDLSPENGESSASIARPETPQAHNSLPAVSASTTASSNSPRVNGGCANSNTNSTSPGTTNQHQLPQPKRILYPREKIVPGYMDKMPVGAGFYNMGNSCYLNASLQAVFHVPAFINWLRQDADHRKNCQDNGCIICAMKKTFDSATGRGSPPPTAIRPVEIINRLRSICRHFSHGRQEDAHEFLRYLFESMERSYLHAINGLRLDNRSKETNPLGQIFGGYIRTEVTCLKCHYVSTTFQPTAELQLDIRHVTTLEDAIQQHFKKERLDNNDYKCEKCRTISQATKQFSLEIPPIVLCLQLKRFTLYGTKIAKRIHCNRFLDMSRFMHKSKQVNGYSNLKYRLVALVTHLGSSPNCGHYTAIAEASNGQFYQFDDSFVHQVTQANALNNDAYVIIYEMDRRSNKSSDASSSHASASSSNYASNLTNLNYPSSTVTSSSNSSSTIIFPKKVPTTHIPKLSSSSTSSTTTPSKLVPSVKSEDDVAKLSSNGNGTSESVNGSSISPGFKGVGLERKMISFGIKPSNNSPKKITILKPGASLTNSSKLGHTSNGTNPGKGLVSSSGATQSTLQKSDQAIKPLVPYNDDEESDKDENVRSGARSVSPNSSNKRLKSPENGRKQSPGRNSLHSSSVSPSKSPKPSLSTNTTIESSPKLSSPGSQDRTLASSSQKTEEATSGDTPRQTFENRSASLSQRDGMKRKAPSDDENTPKKVPSQRRRHSSSSSSSSTSSRSTSGSPDGRRSSKGKRKRSEESSSSRSSDKDKKPLLSLEGVTQNEPSNSGSSRRDRESQSQERDRERRRDRNPSRSRSPSEDANNKDTRGSSTEKKRENSGNGGSFDVSRLRQDNCIVDWNGQKSILSRSMEEERRRSNERSLAEEYDDEFDQGRTKKVRRSRSLPRDSESGFGNRFQSIEDKKRQVSQWSDILDGYGPGFRRSNGGSSSNGTSSESRSWSTGGDDTSRDKRAFLPRPNSSNGYNGSRPRHSSSNGSSHSGYSRNSHGRSPYRNGHYNGGNNGGGMNHYRSQSHSSYHHNSNKHWNNDRNRH